MKSNYKLCCFLLSIFTQSAKLYSYLTVSCSKRAVTYRAKALLYMATKFMRQLLLPLYLKLKIYAPAIITFVLKTILKLNITSLLIALTYKT